MSEEINVKEMIDDLFDEVKDTSLVNEIRYFDWKERKNEYLDVLKSLVDTGAEQFSGAYLEDVPNWVYTMSLVCLLGLPTDNAQQIINDDAIYTEIKFTTPLLPFPCRMKVTKEEDYEQYEIRSEKNNKYLLGIIAVFKPKPDDEDSIQLNLTFVWDKGNVFIGRKVIGFMTMCNLHYLTSFFCKKENM